MTHGVMSTVSDSHRVASIPICSFQRVACEHLFYEDKLLDKQWDKRANANLILTSRYVYLPRSIDMIDRAFSSNP